MSNALGSGVLNTSDLDLSAVNAQLAGCPADAIVRWALQLRRRTIVTTSMGINAAATLHAVCTIDASIPVVWIDSGFNLRDTYLVAEELEQRLKLNLRVYQPRMTAERISARLGGIPLEQDAEKYAWFKRAVKLEPFQRALAEHEPEVWITGIRKEETDYRRGLGIVSWDPRGILKVAPFFEFTEAQLEEYMRRFKLPTCKHYFDPTKASAGSECGLHTAV